MSKIDFKKEPRYKAKLNKLEIIDIPDAQYLMVDGKGNPGVSPDFTAAVETLYPIAFKLKFMSKIDLGKDYVVPPLEGLWWADDMDYYTDKRDKSKWKWTLLILTPDWITQELFENAKLAQKSKNLPRYNEIRLEALNEGKVVQVMHHGSYDDEGPILKKMHHEFIPENGYKMHGLHHEIYLSDPRRTAPEKLKTILRQPITPK